MENSMKISLKTKQNKKTQELPYDPAVGVWNSNSKRYMHPNVHCSTIYNRQENSLNVYQQTSGWRGGTYT